MMQRTLMFAFLLGLVALPVRSWAQPYHDNVWVHADRDDALTINFSDGSPVLTDLVTDLVMDNASASICNAAGDLAFYTNGCRIYNWRHRLMENGDGINPGEIYDEYCDLNDEFPRGYPNPPQSTLIIPTPGYVSEYLLIHFDRRYNLDTSIPNFSVRKHLLVTKIEMSKNDEEGKVIEKNSIVDTLLREPKMALNRHANGKDWWLVNPLLNNNDVSIYLIDSNGVHFHHRQTIGLVDSSFNVSTDQLVFTPLGDQLARFSVQQGLRLFNFDRFTGELSNFRHVPFPQGSPRMQRFGSVAISPSGQFAYVNNQLEVYQYDLWAENIAASQLLVGEMIDDGSMILPPTIQVMQLGPDCKIYGFTVSGMNHHVIHNPDERGDACGWEQGGLPLGRYVFRDQPTFPNFRLGPVGDEGSPCAEPIVSVTDRPPAFSEQVSVFPNPAMREVAFSVTGAVVSRVTLFNATGQVVRLRHAALAAGEIGRLSVNGLPAGVYALRLSLADGRLVVRKLVVR